MENDAPFFDLPNHQNPKPSAPIHYGDLYMPHKTNQAAKRVDASKIMNQVNHAD